jgi:hypothetical protein
LREAAAAEPAVEAAVGHWAAEGLL